MKTRIVTLLLFICFQGKATDPLIDSFKYYRDRSQLDSCQIICEQLISKYPKESEYNIWHAQVQAWKGQYKQAIRELHLLKASSYTYFLLASFHYWDKNYDSAYHHIDKSLSIDSINRESLLLVTKIQYNRKEYKACIELINDHKLDSIPNFKSILKQCYSKIRNKRLSIGHSILLQGNSLNLSSMLGFQLSKKKFTTLSTYTNILSQNVHLIQQEVYTNTKKFGYQYYAIRIASNNFHTPLNLSFVEFYQHRKTEIDLGIRLYRNRVGASLWVPSAGITRHIDKLSMSYRYYLSRSASIKGNTHSFSMKRTLKTSDNYVRLDLAIGAQQDLLNQGLLDVALTNQTLSINLNTSFQINPRFGLLFIGGYNRSTLQKIRVMNSPQMMCQLNYRF